MVFDIFVFLYIFMISACFGSFINVVIDRICKNEKLTFKDRSHCESCGHKLGFVDLIPFFSYVFLGGKCRYCGKKYGISYFLVECFFGLIGVGLFLLYGFSIELLVHFLLFIFLYIIFQVDNKIMEIPLFCNIGILVLGIINCLVLHNINIKSMLIGAVCISGLLFLIDLVKNGFGGGDIKLFFAGGAYLGFPNVLIAFFIALITCMIKIVLKKDKKDMKIPFGPFISIGIFISSIVGSMLINWYCSIVGLNF